MGNFVNAIVNFCLEKGIVSSQNEEWFRYGLEKRISTLLVGIPFFIIAVILSSFWCALCFMASFFYLRGRTNGFHAKTAERCLFISLLLEVVFLLLIQPLLNTPIMIVTMVLIICSIWILAPYNDPNLHLTPEEICAYKRGARIRSVVLFLLFILAILTHISQIAVGITLGCALVEFLLCFAYIVERRNKHAKTSEKSNRNSHSDG